MSEQTTERHLSVKHGALIAGLAVLFMALTVPIVEFYIFPKLIDADDPATTLANIRQNREMFSLAMMIHLGTVLCDVLAAWGLYIFLRPASRLALLVAWTRLVYTAFNIVALAHLAHIISLLHFHDRQSLPSVNALEQYVMMDLNAFHLQWRVGLIFFGVYMLLLAVVVMKARYIPNIIGWCLAVAGIGYLVEDLRYFFYPSFDTGFLWFTFFGELVFMIWLLVKGARTPEPLSGV
jgi:hypothetical protein